MKFNWDIEQGTEEWFNMRRGRATASHFADIITASKGELSKSCQKLVYRLVAESLIPIEPRREFETDAMRRGKELEPEAREMFAETTGHEVRECGIIVASDNVCACSPDGILVDDNGTPFAGLEIKCPYEETHVEYVLNGGLPDTYKQQVHGSMVVSGLDTWHFWSYCPGALPLHVVVQRDEYTEKVAEALKSFVTLYLAAILRGKKLIQLPDWAS